MKSSAQPPPLLPCLVLALAVGCAARAPGAPPKSEARPEAATDQAAPSTTQEPGPSPGAGFAQPGYPLPQPLDVESHWATLDAEEKRLDLALAGDATALSTGDRCSVICKSLASMRTSAGHVCKLADPDRCKAAEIRVRKAEERTKDACPQCATPT
jgi:hypothetical protein